MTHTQRGLSESLQLALLLPLVVGVLLGALTLGSVHHGRTAAREVAAVVAEQVAAGRPTAEAQADGRRMAQKAGLGCLDIAIGTSPREATVHVTGCVQGFLDGVDLMVTAQARSPMEPR